jgi:type II secretory pathway predicted ATPase ExeA
MTQAERFMQFVQQRNEQAIQNLQVSIRVDEGCLVVTQRWIDRSASESFASPTTLRKTATLSRRD